VPLPQQLERPTREAHHVDDSRATRSRWKH
jgi:hypothetical protein